MKKINKLFVWLILPMMVMSCDEDETADVSSITYYPLIEVTGPSFLWIGLNESFSEPGVSATEKGQTIDVVTSYTGRFSGYSGNTLPNEPDQYNVIYSAINVDGFAGTASRTLVKIDNGDMVSDISGLYEATVTRVGGESYSGIRVLIWELSPGVFEISSTIAGFYGEGRGFGDGYLGRGGTITINDITTNDFTFGTAVFPLWGDPVAITSMTVDASTKTIDYVAETSAFGNGYWDITLVQVQP